MTPEAGIKPRRLKVDGRITLHRPTKTSWRTFRRCSPAFLLTGSRVLWPALPCRLLPSPKRWLTTRGGATSSDVDVHLLSSLVSFGHLGCFSRYCLIASSMGFLSPVVSAFIIQHVVRTHYVISDHFGPWIHISYYSIYSIISTLLPSTPSDPPALLSRTIRNTSTYLVTRSSSRGGDIVAPISPRTATHRMAPAPRTYLTRIRVLYASGSGDLTRPSDSPGPSSYRVGIRLSNRQHRHLILGERASGPSFSNMSFFRLLDFSRYV